MSSQTTDAEGRSKSSSQPESVDESSETEPSDKPTPSGTDSKSEDIDTERLAKIRSGRSKQRLYPGMKREELMKYKVTAISEKMGMYAVREHIEELIRNDYTQIERIIHFPRDITGAEQQLRFVVESMKLFLVEVGFFVVFLSSQCNHTNCSKMQATNKFRYRCSAHRKPKDCNAIQYCVHTLDLFTERMNHKEYHIQNTKINEKKANKDIGDLCRRVYRIFAHAFFHHQQLFEEYESRHLLCTRFIMFFRTHKLVPMTLFKREIQIPPSSLYTNRQTRKQKLQQFLAKRKQMEMQQKSELEKAKRRHQSMTDESLKNSQNVAELDFEEAY